MQQTSREKDIASKDDDEAHGNINSVKCITEKIAFLYFKKGFLQ